MSLPPFFRTTVRFSWTFVLLCTCGCANWQAGAPLQDDAGPPISWDWVGGMPESMPRAELVPPTIKSADLANILSRAEQSHKLIETIRASEAELHISALSGTEIRSFADFHLALHRATQGRRRAEHKITIATDGGESLSFPLPNEVLPALSQIVALDCSAMRISEDGNQWVLGRQDGVVVKLMARVERTVGLLQIVISLERATGADVMLPVDVAASCDGTPLRCLSTSETLELLYGDRKHKRPAQNSAVSFAAVSEREDYLVPTNFKYLQERFDEATRHALTSPTLPALATAPGVTYPGSPVLGDARAAATFLLQRQRYKAGDLAQTGWILFSGEPLRTAHRVELRIDLGGGPIPFSFALPAR